MASTRTRLAAAAAASVLALGAAAAVATPAQAVPAGASVVAAAAVPQPTSAQLASWGFTKKPNVTGWGGTAAITTNSAPQYADVIVSGKAASFTQPGQKLTLMRFVPSDNKGSGTMVSTGITTTVNKNRSFTLHMQLGRVGLYGYTLGYGTGGSSPEFVGIEFQLRTTSA